MLWNWRGPQFWKLSLDLLSIGFYTPLWLRFFFNRRFIKRSIRSKIGEWILCKLWTRWIWWTRKLKIWLGGLESPMTLWRAKIILEIIVIRMWVWGIDSDKANPVYLVGAYCKTLSWNYPNKMELVWNMDSFQIERIVIVECHFTNNHKQIEKSNNKQKEKKNQNQVNRRVDLDLYVDVPRGQRLFKFY